MPNTVQVKRLDLEVTTLCKGKKLCNGWLANFNMQLHIIWILINSVLVYPSSCDAFAGVLLKMNSPPWPSLHSVIISAPSAQMSRC